MLFDPFAADVQLLTVTLSEVADDLGCDWYTVMDAVSHHGKVLIDDPNRIRATTAVGLDEVLFCRDGKFEHRLWSTQIEAESGVPVVGSSVGSAGSSRAKSCLLLSATQRKPSQTSEAPQDR